jgi:pimeloyl-ACP methyl ester carboxylesterase
LAYVFAHLEPARVRGLLIMNSPHPDIWGHPEIDPELARAGESYIPMIAGPLGALVIPVVELMLAAYLSAEEAAAYRMAWDRTGAAAAMAKWYSANNYPEYKLPSGVTVDVPTLALAGVNDTFVTPSQLDPLPRFVSKLKTARIEGVDHWMTHQITAELVRRIREFEGELPPAQRAAEPSPARR